MKKKPNKILRVRFPKSQLQKVAEIAKLAQVTPTQVINVALATYVINERRQGT